MCSVGDDNIDDLEASKYMPAIEKPPPFSKCNKCREEKPIVLLRSKDRYCKGCFLAGTVHKFKALLGKHKLIRPKDKVLVVYKCGHSSTALLHFIKTGIELETHKRLRFEPVVIFIEDHSTLSLDERRELLEKVEHHVGKFKFPLFFASMTALLKMGSVDEVVKTKPELVDLTIEENKKQRNTTNQSDFLHIIRQKWLIQIAKYLRCNFVFTPEISSDVASQLLTDVSLGRGSQIALNTGFCDSRDPDVKILRPLRLFDIKELAFYNFLNDLEPVAVRTWVENPYSSVQLLMKKFVNDLQTNYPATVTTIFKTGDKLVLDTEDTEKCELCNAPISKESLDLTSAESTQFSHWVSTQAQDGALTSQERYLKTLEAFNNFTCDTYCFSCRQLMK